MKGPASGKDITATYTLKDLFASLKKPHVVIIMVKAGAPVDEVISQIEPYFEPGDLIIDGGNSHFQDTDRRSKEMEAKGIRYMGVGISGGEEGALWGPSIMPGGPREAYDVVEPILRSISAKVNNQPCVTYIGPRGSGHFVKMVHNAIEYGDMQLIAEATMCCTGDWDFPRTGCGRYLPIGMKGLYLPISLRSPLISSPASTMRRKNPW
jgi:6-phosphogluconate dehydrogenase